MDKISTITRKSLRLTKIFENRTKFDAYGWNESKISCEGKVFNLKLMKI